MPPTAPTPTLGTAEARHLLARTGFGPTASEVREYARLTRGQAVDRLLAATTSEPRTPVPQALLAVGPIRRPGPDASEEERRAFRVEQAREALALRGWWIEEMRVTRSPLLERMTLFWHNHFASSQQKVRFARLMYRQNATFRQHALGDFRALLHAAAKEPAMLVYLDVAQNRRGTPNENFAREVMELFTLGEGRYAEDDVREAARAFTGWSIDRDDGAFRFRPALHDAGVKRVLGRSGRFDGDAVLDILLDQPATAEHLVTKLWREFVSPEPDAREVGRIAERMRRSGYSIRVAVRELLLTDAFFDAANRGSLVKSPVEVVVGTLRQLELAPADAAPLALSAAAMGQNLFAPPNVKGWPGGDAWINASTLLARKAFVERLVSTRSAPAPSQMTIGDAMQSAAGADDASPDQRDARARRIVERGMRDLRFDASRWLDALPGETDEARRNAARELLLPLPGSSDVPEDREPSTLVRGWVLEAAYQLK